MERRGALAEAGRTYQTQDRPIELGAGGSQPHIVDLVMGDPMAVSIAGRLQRTHAHLADAAEPQFEISKLAAGGLICLPDRGLWLVEPTQRFSLVIEAFRLGVDPRHIELGDVDPLCGAGMYDPSVKVLGAGIEHQLRLKVDVMWLVVGDLGPYRSLWTAWPPNETDVR